MRLWHQDLIPYLPNLQLLGQHRELCALRGKGFGKKHATVDYVFQHPYCYLFYFHVLVMKEMKRRGFKIDPLWEDYHYRGKQIGFDFSPFTKLIPHPEKIYSEHDSLYFQECIENLEKKHIILFP